jgi:hypothetical protein
MELLDCLMVKSGSSQMHTTSPDVDENRNDPEGLHVCYPCNDTEILGLLMCKSFIGCRGLVL